MIRHPKTIVVHHVGHAEAALNAAAKNGVPVVLRSAAGAASYLGPPVFRAMVEAAREKSPMADAITVMDCGEDAGHALAALRHGLDRVRVALPAATKERIAAIARQYGAAIDDDDRPPLDLHECGDPAVECQNWLAIGGK